MRIITDVDVCETASGRCGTLRALFDSGASHSLVNRKALDKKVPGAIIGGFSPSVSVPSVLGAPSQKTDSVAQLQFSAAGCRSLPGTYLVVNGMNVDLLIGADQLESNELELVFRKAPNKGFVKFSLCPPRVSPGAFDMKKMDG